MTVLDAKPVALTARRCAVAGGRVYCPCYHCGAPLSVDEGGAKHEGGARVTCAKCRRTFFMQQSRPGPAVAAPAAGTGAAPRPGGTTNTPAANPAGDYRGGMARVLLDLNTLDGYRTFLKVKALPAYSFVGREAVFPAEYAALVGGGPPPVSTPYTPRPALFDYQAAVAGMAVRKRKFAAFVRCGLGKTLIGLEFARHALAELPPSKCVLMVAPLMVVRQTVEECRRFYGDSLPIEQVRAKDLPGWLLSGAGRFGITNYEALTEAVPQGRLGALIPDESSSMKSHYGFWGQQLIRLGRGLGWKLCLTGLAAPNDRIEYANHAVFLDQYPTVNSFLAKFFVNRGETNERWEMKPHALRPFYRALSHWCVFLTRPAAYGFKDNAAPLPPINVHIEDVPLTAEQKDEAHRIAGGLPGAVWVKSGGIGSRAKWARLAKGFREDGAEIPTNKPGVVCDLAADAPSIVWCRYNPEQEALARMMPGCADVTGSTKEADRFTRIDAFKRGEMNPLLTKPDILGFGVNLQCARRQVFSTVQDSYEDYHQAVHRSNRTGSTAPLDVFLPVTELEYPMLDTVLAKAKRVQADEEEQEQLFKEVSRVGF